MTTFDPSVPTGLVPLDQDYQNIQLNFSQINTTYGTNHVPLTNATGSPPAGVNGMHSTIQMISQTTPATIASVGNLYQTLFNDGKNTDTTLYFKSGLGNVIQLTRNFLPVLNTNGYTFLPGGIIFQWGTSSVPAGGTQAVTFPISFTSTCYNVQVTGIRSNSGGDGVFVLTGSVSNTGFTLRNGSGSITSAYWVAIGN